MSHNVQVLETVIPGVVSGTSSTLDKYQTIKNSIAWIVANSPFTIESEATSGNYWVYLKYGNDPKSKLYISYYTSGINAISGTYYGYDEDGNPIYNTSLITNYTNAFSSADNYVKLINIDNVFTAFCMGSSRSHGFGGSVFCGMKILRDGVTSSCIGYYNYGMSSDKKSSLTVHWIWDDRHKSCVFDSRNSSSYDIKSILMNNTEPAVGKITAYPIGFTDANGTAVKLFGVDDIYALYVTPTVFSEMIGPISLDTSNTRNEMVVPPFTSIYLTDNGVTYRFVNINGVFWLKVD